MMEGSPTAGPAFYVERREKHIFSLSGYIRSNSGGYQEAFQAHNRADTLVCMNMEVERGLSSIEGLLRALDVNLRESRVSCASAQNMPQPAHSSPQLSITNPASNHKPNFELPLEASRKKEDVSSHHNQNKIHGNKNNNSTDDINNNK